MIRATAVLTTVLLSVAACDSPEPAPAAPPTPVGPPEVEVPEVDSLTTEWDCGRGFWVSNPDQTAALHIRYQGDEVGEQRVTLPHGDWEAEVVLGTDLHANWCDDVLEPDEPTPVRQENLPVVAGDLRVIGAVPEDFGGGGGVSLTVEATDLVVELPDGTETRFGSLTITNAHWGLIPG